LKRTTQTTVAVLCALFVSGAAAAAPALGANDVYVLNNGDGSAFQYSIGTGGALSALSPPSTPAAGQASDQPVSGAVAMNGGFLYATSSYLKLGQAYGEISSLPIGAGGLLGTPVSAQLGTATDPLGVAVDPLARTVYVAENGADQIAVLDVAPDGSLYTPASGATVASGVEPYALAVSPSGQSLYATDSGDNTVAQYTIASDGTLTANGSPVATADHPGASFPDAIVLAPNGAMAYVADGAGDTISEYAIGTNGQLSLLAGHPKIGTGSDPTAIVMTPNGQYVYVANTLGNSIYAYSVEPDGSLTQLGSATVSTTEPTALAIAPSGSYLYATNGGTPGGVSEFQIAADGSLSEIGTSPAVLVGDSPSSIVVTPDAGPTAAFSANAANAGSASSFDASASTAGSAPIGTYSWQFGDGSSGSGVTPQHTYATAGQYTVTLTVAGTDSCSNALPFTGVTPFCLADGAASVSHVITVGSAPVPAFSAVSAGLPSVTITVPKNGANYGQDATVLANFSCADGLNAPGLLPGGTGCLGTVADGQSIDTVPGKHSFTVTATSKDGQKATKTVTYTSNGWLNANRIPKGHGPIHGYNCPDHIAATFYMTASSAGHTRIVAKAAGKKVASRGIKLPVRKRTLIVLCLSRQGVAYATRNGSPQPFGAMMNATNRPYGGSTHLRIKFTIR
jgi:6-phosphogluconolactonase (cycloisomerase 2 family)/PKD repeat protein